MTVFDRYLLVLFFKIFIVCMISFTGLFIVIHMSTNLDELAAAGEKSGGLPQVMFDFYLPRILDIFDRSAGILVLISAIFSLGLIERRREMTAIQSAGIAKLRLVRPIIFASVVIIGLSIVNREVWIPKVKRNLVKSLQSWSDDAAVPMSFYKDQETRMLIRGEELFLGEQKITGADVQLPVHLSPELSELRAEYGTIQKASGQRPAGLFLHQVSSPSDLSELDSIMLGERTIVYSPKDHDWLRPNQCYVAINLDADEIAYGKQLAKYSTLEEMMASLRRPRYWLGHSQQVEVHARILKPVMDMTILLLGLPLVIGKSGQNIFTSAGFCLLIVVVVQITSIASYSLGNFNLIRPAALAAWLPVLVFLPAAVVAMRRLKS